MDARPRARDVGIRIGPLPPGPHNAITDVPGVRVGHVTLNSGAGDLHVTSANYVLTENADQAYHFARSGAVDEGCVGGGMGMSAFAFKGGIGTSSRIAELGGESGTVGVLVQSNFGGRLAIDGVPM